MRSNGMGGNAAAILSGNNAANQYNSAYTNAFSDQQNKATEAGNNAINAYQNQANSAQAEKNNIYNRANGNRTYLTNTITNGIQAATGSAASILGAISDETTKTDIMKVSYKDISKDIDDKLNKRSRFANLIWRKK